MIVERLKFHGQNYLISVSLFCFTSITQANDPLQSIPPAPLGGKYGTHDGLPWKHDENLHNPIPHISPLEQGVYPNGRNPGLPAPPSLGVIEINKNPNENQLMLGAPDQPRPNQYSGYPSRVPSYIPSLQNYSPNSGNINQWQSSRFSSNGVPVSNGNFPQPVNGNTPFLNMPTVQGYIYGKPQIPIPGISSFSNPFQVAQPALSMMGYPYSLYPTNLPPAVVPLQIPGVFFPPATHLHQAVLSPVTRKTSSTAATIAASNSEESLSKSKSVVGLLQAATEDEDEDDDDDSDEDTKILARVFDLIAEKSDIGKLRRTQAKTFQPNSGLDESYTPSGGGFMSGIMKTAGELAGKIVEDSLTQEPTDSSNEE